MLGCFVLLCCFPLANECITITSCGCDRFLIIVNYEPVIGLKEWVCMWQTEDTYMGIFGLV